MLPLKMHVVYSPKQTIYNMEPWTSVYTIVLFWYDYSDHF